MTSKRIAALSCLFAFALGLTSCAAAASREPRRGDRDPLNHGQEPGAQDQEQTEPRETQRKQLPVAPPPVELLLPDGAFHGLTAGESRSLPIRIENKGEIPVVILGIELSGLGRGSRRLAIDVVEETGHPPDTAGGGGRLRAFGLIAPEETGTFRIGAFFPDPGEGEVILTLRLRVLPPKTEGETMREITIPKEEDEVFFTHSFSTEVLPLPFPREAAEARVGIEAEDALLIKPLGAWFLRKGNETYLVSVDEALEFPGMSLGAAALLDDSQDEKVPILDQRGRLMEVPHGPVLGSILKNAQEMGWAVSVEEKHGRQVIRVGP